MCYPEISYSQRIAPLNVFEWVDITVQPEALLQVGVSLQDGLKSLHVATRDGKIYQGTDALILISEHIPRFRWLVRIIRVKLLYQIATLLYAKFAAWHFKHMGYEKCGI